MPPYVHPERPHHPDPPEQRTMDVPSWAESVFELVGARIALFQVEAKQAAGRGIGRIVMVAGAAFAAVVAWFLLMAAIAGIVHAFTGFAWYWTCLAMGGIHLLAMAALLRGARAPSTSSFEHTRSEFQKDREWLKNLQHRKSKP